MDNMKLLSMVAAHFAMYPESDYDSFLKTAKKGWTYWHREAWHLAIHYSRIVLTGNCYAVTTSYGYGKTVQTWRLNTEKPTVVAMEDVVEPVWWDYTK